MGGLPSPGVSAGLCVVGVLGVRCTETGRTRRGVLAGRMFVEEASRDTDGVVDRDAPPSRPPRGVLTPVPAIEAGLGLLADCGLRMTPGTGPGVDTDMALPGLEPGVESPDRPSGAREAGNVGTRSVRRRATEFHITGAGRSISSLLSLSHMSSCNADARRVSGADAYITLLVDDALRAAQKNPEVSAGSKSRGVEEPKANADRGEERACLARSNLSSRSFSLWSKASRRDIEASHIARFLSST